VKGVEPAALIASLFDPAHQLRDRAELVVALDQQR
jgi:hypothetical protein